MGALEQKFVFLWLSPAAIWRGRRKCRTWRCWLCCVLCANGWV